MNPVDQHTLADDASYRSIEKKIARTKIKCGKATLGNLARSCKTTLGEHAPRFKTKDTYNAKAAAEMWRVQMGHIEGGMGCPALLRCAVPLPASPSEDGWGVASQYDGRNRGTWCGRLDGPEKGRRRPEADAIRNRRVDWKEDNQTIEWYRRLVDGLMMGPSGGQIGGGRIGGKVV